MPGRKRTLQIVDLFCGAGGMSTGALQAIDALGRSADLSAINHWPTAISTHAANHIEVQHHCMSVDQAKPQEVVPGGKLDLLLAAPSCTHHSSARGGRPTSDQKRADPWMLIDWLTQLRVKRVLFENVPEFRDWGPVSLTTGRPLRVRKGEYFRAWIQALESLGYRVEHRILNAADFGEATTRKRLFVQAVQKPLRVRWPAPTHAKPGSLDVFGGLRPWRPAREIIDWTLPGKSIFTRTRPLAIKTLQRIEEGFRRFGGPLSGAFVLVLRNHADGLSLDEPLPTITAAGSHFGLVEPVVLGQQSGGIARPVSNPLPTIAAGGAVSVVEPLLVNMKGRSTCQRSSDPTPTMTAHARHLGIAEGFAVRVNDAKPRPPIDLEGQLPTLTTRLGIGLCQPFVVPYYATGVADTVEEPLATVTTRARFGLCYASVANDDRIPTVIINGHPFKLDIRFRMLEGHELAAAMGFPVGYHFDGTKADVNKQIGNAVSVRKARALVYAMLADA